MIEVTRLNGVRFWINANLIEQIESAPDTVITTTTGNNFIVKESVEAVVEKVVFYQSQVERRPIKAKMEPAIKGAR
jgi:flagellar protein FlbD